LRMAAMLAASVRMESMIFMTTVYRESGQRATTLQNLGDIDFQGYPPKPAF